MGRPIPTPKRKRYGRTRQQIEEDDAEWLMQRRRNVRFFTLTLAKLRSSNHVATN